jgi:hypothetical protein
MNLNSLTHIQLEMLSEDAEEYLFDKGIPLTSHSYKAIIIKAQRHGFKIKVN